MAMEKLKVLVIEDNPADFRLLKEALKPHVKDTFDLFNESSLEGGLKRISIDQVDLVLLDLFLPESSGLETLARVREAAPQTPVIVLSGVYTEWLALHALSLGACCFFHKERLNGKGLMQAFRYYSELKSAV